MGENSQPKLEKVQVYFVSRYVFKNHSRKVIEDFN